MVPSSFYFKTMAAGSESGKSNQMGPILYCSQVMLPCKYCFEGSICAELVSSTNTLVIPKASVPLDNK